MKNYKIKTVLWCNVEALVKGKITPEKICHGNQSPIPSMWDGDTDHSILDLHVRNLEFMYPYLWNLKMHPTLLILASEIYIVIDIYFSNDSKGLIFNMFKHNTIKAHLLGDQKLRHLPDTNLFPGEHCSECWDGPGRRIQDDWHRFLLPQREGGRGGHRPLACKGRWKKGGHLRHH